VTGGLAATSKQMLWSFPGGLVYNLGSLLQDVQQLNMTNFPYVPAPLPGTSDLPLVAFFFVCFFEAFSQLCLLWDRPFAPQAFWFPA
jgi:hypothetical protein